MTVLFSILGESFLSKIAEKLIDYTLDKKDEATLQSLKSNISSLSAKAIDVGDEIDKGEMSGKKKRKREVQEWLQNVKDIEADLRTLEKKIETEGFLKQFFGGGRATKLNARVQGLVEQSRHFGEHILDVCDLKGETLLTKGFVGEKFEENLERILNFLLIDKVPTIGILGLGGMGKTMLAKHINNRLIERSQEYVVWIDVSQELDIRMLQNKIANAVGLNLSDEYHEDKRASRLNKALSKRKNLVIIFDDVWDDIDLEKVGDPLSIEGCRLLITTRSREVCNRIGCREVIEVKPLPRSEAWTLFTKTLGEDSKLTSQVQEIARSMVKLCDGLPLGIITLAGSMKGETVIRVWRDALEGLMESLMGQSDMEKQVFKVLKYSFDQLDGSRGSNNGYSKLQLCFLYCSLYPQDSEIDREELTRNFILEGFLDKRKSRKAFFEQGYTILDKLVHVCLLERKAHDRFKMHALVRAMALKINEGNGTIFAAGNYDLMEIAHANEWAKDLQKMSFKNSGITTISPGISPYCPKLSTLLLDRNPLEFIPNSFFLRMLGLCTLDLSRTNIEKLPNSLSKMKNLRALLLVDCQYLQYVPNLAKLKKLKELDLARTAIQEVPKGMEKLANLEFLSMHACHNLMMLPRCLLLKFPFLKCLHLPFHIQAPREEIEELKYLEEFSGRAEHTCDFNWLVGGRGRYSIQMGSDSPCGDYEYIGYNQLHFSKYDFKKIKDRDVTLLAQDTQHLVFYACEGLSSCFMEDLPRLNNPTSLVTLYFHECEGIEFLSRREQVLPFSIMDSISLKPPPPRSIFSSLGVLRIYECNKMKKIGIPASELQNLKKLSIESCEMIEEIMEVVEDHGRGKSGEAPVVTLLKLTFLHFENLPRLKNICNAMIHCSSLMEIVLKRCLALKRLPLVFEQPFTLRNICIRNDEWEWWEMLELGHPTLHRDVLLPFLRISSGTTDTDTDIDADTDAEMDTFSC